MSFCSSCGAQNSDDARFCNKCGTTMGAAAPAASSGSTGATPPPMSTGGSTVTLSGIGIQSPGKTYAVLAVGALLFLGLGAGIAWVGMRGGAATPTATTDGTADASDTTGETVPEGVDVPEDDWVMTPTGRVRRGSLGGGGATGGTPAGIEATPPATRAAGGHATGTGSGTGSGSGSGSGSGTGTGSGSGSGSGTGTGTGTGTHGGGTPIDPPPTTTVHGGGTTPPPSSGSPDWDSLSGTTADPGEEPDLTMDMYTTQVRRFIRQYLIPQSTSCFEHASATSRDPIHGTVAIGFEINARGHAGSATIDRNTTGNDTLAHCLQNNVNTWQLPRPPEGTAPLLMQQPFTR